MKLVNLIIRDLGTRDWKIWVENFVALKDMENPEAEFRAAIQDFLNSGTKEAKQAISYSGGYFNWGDAVSSVPQEYFYRRGFYYIGGREVVDINVEHDEILCDDETPVSVSDDGEQENFEVQKEGHCPECGSEALEYGDGSLEDGGYRYQWTCSNCGASGTEWYNLEFSEHRVEEHGKECDGSTLEVLEEGGK